MNRAQLKEIPLIKLLSSLKITVTCLALLFILTFGGTVSQVENGLFYAQNRFFYSLGFLVFGFFPFPGARLVLWVLFINLLAAAIRRFVFRWSHLGILIIHFGLLTYFVSAFVTFHYSQESNLTLMEGEGANVSSAYHDWELSVWREEGKKRKVVAYDAKKFQVGKILSFPEYGLSATVELFYPNTDAYTASDKMMQSDTVNASGINSLNPLRVNKEPEKNIPGGIFLFKSADGKKTKVLLFGGEIESTQIVSQGQTYHTQLRPKRFVLPFILKLKDFRMQLHPNTQVARSYESLVEVSNNDLSREVLISMNNPLRFKDYTLYQSSYMIDTLGRESSTLAVVKNFGRLLPYISSLVTFAGLVIHFLMMAFGRKRREHHNTSHQAPGKKFISFFSGVLVPGALVLLLGSSAFAQPIPPKSGERIKAKGLSSLQTFERLAILQDGRIKPIDTYARNVLLQFYGRQSFRKEKAVHWLARLLFDPESTLKDKVFLINNPEIAAAIGIAPEEHRRYSFNQLQPGFDKLAELAEAAQKIDDKNQSLVEREIIRLYSNLQFSAQLSRSLVFAFPHEDFDIPERKLVQMLQLPENQPQFSFLDVALKADRLYAASKDLQGKDPSSWTAEEQRSAQLMANLYQWSSVYHDLPFAIIPSYEKEHEQWVSPWDAMAAGFHTKQGSEEIVLLRDMVVSYWNGEQLAFDIAAKSFSEKIEKRVEEKHPDALREIPLEIVYNKADFFFVGKIVLCSGIWYFFTFIVIG